VDGLHHSELCLAVAFQDAGVGVTAEDEAALRLLPGLTPGRIERPGLARLSTWYAV